MIYGVRNPGRVVIGDHDEDIFTRRPSLLLCSLFTILWEHTLIKTQRWSDLQLA